MRTVHRGRIQEPVRIQAKGGTRPRTHGKARGRDPPGSRWCGFLPASGTWASHRAWRNTWLPAAAAATAAATVTAVSPPPPTRPSAGTPRRSLRRPLWLPPSDRPTPPPGAAKGRQLRGETGEGAVSARGLVAAGRGREWRRSGRVERGGIGRVARREARRGGRERGRRGAERGGGMPKRGAREGITVRSLSPFLSLSSFGREEEGVATGN